MATTSNLAATLSQAIDNASETTIRAVLKAMCQSSEECSKHAASYLLVPSTQQAPSLKRKTVIDPRTADQDEPADKKPKTAGDALEPRYEKCTTCKASFDVTTNTDTACKVHDGSLEIDDECFPDDDEVQDGHIDPHTDWRREEWPEGFIWTCCEQNCENAGCVVGPHIALRR